MAHFAQEREKLQRSSSIKVVAGGQFTGDVMPIDLNTLVAGDEFVLPTTYEVYEQAFGTGGNSRTTQFILVDVNGEGKRFYPSTLWKRRMVVKDDGTPTGQWEHASGTMVDEFQKYGSVNDAMNALKGRRVRITNMKQVKTLNFAGTRVSTANIPVIDLV